MSKWKSKDGRVLLFNVDCLRLLRKRKANSIDAIVTDPPYGLSQHKQKNVEDCLKAWINGKAYVPKGGGFMGKSWDAWVPGPEAWRECFRVLKPGGHISEGIGSTERRKTVKCPPW